MLTEYHIYFHDRNYTGLYLFNFFDTLSKSLIHVFSLVLLYQLGLSIPFLMLYLALRFGFMGAFSPLSLTLSKLIGISGTIIVAGLIELIGVTILLFSNASSVWLAFSTFIFFSLKGALINPLINGSAALRVEPKHYGRFNSLNAIFVNFANLLALGVGSLLLINGEKLTIVILSLIFVIISSLAFKLLVTTITIPQNYTFLGTYKYLFADHFKENVLPFSMNTFLIVERLVLPLFIFIFIGDLQQTAFIIVLAVLLEFIAQLLFGRRLDRFAKKSFKQSVIFRSSNSLLLLLSPLVGAFVYIAQAYSRIAHNIFNTAFRSNIQTKANHKKDPLLFTTSAEMALCFGEIFFLFTLAGVSVFIGQHVFLVIFLATFIAAWTIYLSWKN